MKPKKLARLPLQALVINREARFYIKPVPGSCHCGAQSAIDENGLLPVDYFFTAKCKPVTDNRGFLFDQLDVDTWIRQYAKKETTLSCELLARAIAEMLVENISKHSPTCRIVGLELKLSPYPFQASITVRYGEI